MTPTKRLSALVLGSAITLLLGSVVPTAALAVEDTPAAVESVEYVEPSESVEAPDLNAPELNAPELDVPGLDAPEANAPDAPAGVEEAQQAGKLAPTGASENAPTAAVAARRYTVAGTLSLPSGAGAQDASLLLVNAAYLKGWQTPGAVSVNASYTPKTGAWSATGVPPGEYRLWFARGGHQLLPGKVVVTNKNLTGQNVSIMAAGQPVVGFFAPAGTRDRVESVVFRNAAGKETSVPGSLSALGLATNPFTDLSATGLCQTGGSGMEFWCPALAPGKYTLRFNLSNGKSVYYNGDQGSSTARDSVKGTTSSSRATQFNVSLMQTTSLQSVDLSSHFGAKTPSTGGNAGTFTDVPKNHKFYNDIEWLSSKKITTGVKQKDGTLRFLPAASVTREAMIAFLYRANGVKNYQPKGKSPFVDVKRGDQFYTQIMWAYETKVTTGIKLPNGKRSFAPKASITREAMAAFMYRQYGKQLPAGSASPRFTDVPAKHKFAKEIRWMASNQITTGTKQPGGSVKFLPKGATSREATAAFLHRAELKLQ